MLPATVNRAQLELAAWRTWLRLFTSRAGSSSGSSKYIPASNRQFASEYVHVQRQQLSTRNTARKAGNTRPKVYHDQQQRRGGIPEQPSGGVIDVFRKVIEEENTEAMIALYSGSSLAKDLGERDIVNTAQLLHFSVRKYKQIDAAERDRTELEAFVEFAEQLVRDTKKGTLMPSPQAYMHILGSFKSAEQLDTGIKFWNWLRKKEDGYATPSLYGIAIEMLALQGQSLPELEDLYEEALIRFPGNFSAYHLSPQAILPDRDQEFTAGRIPMTLVQGIINARLMCGDTRNAYLALDAALRIYPTIAPVRIFALFWKERPLPEALTVFGIACRAGIQIPTSYLQSLLIDHYQYKPDQFPAAHSRILAVRVMLSVVYSYARSGGSVAQRVVNPIIVRMARLCLLGDCDPEQKKQISTLVLEIIRRALETFARLGATPGMGALNAIILNVGGHGQSKETIGIALKDAMSLNLQPTMATMRSVLIASGLLKDPGFVRRAWSSLIDFLAQDKNQPSQRDFRLLVHACFDTYQPEFARAMIEEHSKTLRGFEVAGLLEELERGPKSVPSQPSTSLDLDAVQKGLEKINADLEAIVADMKSDPQAQTQAVVPLRVTVVNTPPDLQMPEVEMRAFYDSLTTEQSTATNDASTVSPRDETQTPDTTPTARKPALSPTSIPLGELRYQNWKTVNHLLWLAEQHDKRFNEAIDQAIAQGKKPPTRSSDLGSPESASPILGMSELLRDDGTRGQITDQSITVIEDVKQRILRLRGIAAG